MVLFEVSLPISVVGERAAVAKDALDLFGDEGLATQNAVLVGKREPHQLDIFFLDRGQCARCRVAVLRGPKVVRPDEVGSAGAALARIHPRCPPKNFACAEIAGIV